MRNRDRRQDHLSTHLNLTISKLVAASLSMIDRDGENIPCPAFKAGGEPIRRVGALIPARLCET